MSNCERCNDYGGNWPDGQPNPTRTWVRGQGPNCDSYGLFDTYQLDMRRKAETLQHVNNQSNWTKKQRFSYLARRPSQPHASGSTFMYKNPGTRACPKPPARNPSSSSDVPGNMILFYDPSVPLTNWRVQRVQTNAGGKNIAKNKIDCTGDKGTQLVYEGF